jgi:hypothetical protein
MDFQLITLRRIFNRLCEALENDGITAVKIEKDYYWHIPAGERYDPYDDPDSLTLGQLSDDLDMLEKLIDEGFEPTGLDWVHFSAILAAVGEARE